MADIIEFLKGFNDPVHDQLIFVKVQLCFCKLSEAIERVCASLPGDFPADIRDSIAGGALKRLKGWSLL